MEVQPSKLCDQMHSDQSHEYIRNSRRKRQESPLGGGGKGKKNCLLSKNSRQISHTANLSPPFNRDKLIFICNRKSNKF